MTDTDALKAAGFITIQVEPLKWHVRGQEGMMEFWPVLKKCRPPHTYGKPVPYEDPVAAVKDSHYMIPYDVPTPEQEEAFREWKDRLECVSITIHNAMTCGKKARAVKSKKVKKAG